MNEDGAGKGVWVGFGIAGVVAVLFLILWLLRGWDMDRLSADLGKAEATASSLTRRLESEAQTAKSEAAASVRRAEELEKKIRDDARRAGEEAALLERRFRSEMDLAAQKLAEAGAQMEKLRLEARTAAEAPVAALRAELEAARKDLDDLRQAGEAELAAAKAEWGQDRNRIRALEESALEKDAVIAALRRELGRNGAASSSASAATTAEAVAAAAPGAEALREAMAREEVLRRRLDEALTALRDGERAAADKAEEVEATWRDRVAALEKEFAAFQENAAKTLRESEASWTGKVAELEKKAAESAAAAAAAVAGTVNAAGETANAAAAAEKAAEAEKAIAAEKAALAQEKAAVEAAKAAVAEKAAAVERELSLVRQESETAKQDLEKVTQELEAAKQELLRRRNESAAAEQLWRQKAEALEQSVAEAGNEAAALREQMAAQGRDFTARLDVARREATAKLEALEKTYRDRLETLRKTSEQRLAAARDARDKEKATLESRIAELEAEAEQAFGLSAPGRSIGRIVERLPGDQVLLISGGVQERMRPGLKFDVFRPVGERDRRVGGVRVIRVMDGYSMAVATPVDADVLLCPATGRAVLEPGVRFSPFAAGKDGKPLPLRKAGDMALVLEAPAIGDSLDNPFYDPARPLAFVMSPALSGNACAASVVERLGGLVRGAGEKADFMVIADETERPDVMEGTRLVTLAHLASYLEPRPNIDGVGRTGCDASAK